ncbi:hypothetical protein C8J57DRAFT_1329876 [Mycena rebaudengoi]|nr:hypothetical protein C8J57DRAFT_1329876 [Mycena rebaudengoi]
MLWSSGTPHGAHATLVDKAGFNTEDTPYPLLLSSHYPSPVHTPRRSMRCSPHNLSADPYALLSVHRCIKFQFIISATPTFLPFLHSCYIIGLHPRPRSTAHLWRTLVCFVFTRPTLHKPMDAGDSTFQLDTVFTHIRRPSFLLLMRQHISHHQSL